MWFGLLFVIVLFAVAAAKERLGQGGLYVVAGLSGLTDMDAISLSTTQLVNSGTLGPASGWRIILVAALSNLIFKACGYFGIRAPAIVHKNWGTLRGCDWLSEHCCCFFGLLKTTPPKLPLEPIIWGVSADDSNRGVPMDPA